ncbi:single-stranded DNA-binding protein WHY1, chloroplastic [Canna indica]|uniref:Single-stranded DNA-binding protein WHY1, chloroplastic n=1 Tax=Canna indica TaxID=4628 RepID=A0AAQ3KGT6_9LILI|nr:single-stranded DNA-binding protein WHY1, chloroplastic [Canna indica]
MYSPSSLPLRSCHSAPSPLLPSPSAPLRSGPFSPRTLSLGCQNKLEWRQLCVRCRRSDFFDQQRFNARPPSPPTSEYPSSFAPQPHAAEPSRVFVGYSIYKGKAALTIDPRAPEFAPLDSGAFKVSKEGFILLQFAPAVGTRQYDWNRKQVFSLSVAEIGHLMSLGPKDSCEFFHDPNKGRSEEGKIRKVLKAEPLPDGTGHFFNLSVQNRLLNVDESIYIPITKAEFSVLNSAFNFIIPYLLGWHAFANAIKPENSFRTSNARLGAESEWGR